MPVFLAIKRERGEKRGERSKGSGERMRERQKIYFSLFLLVLPEQFNWNDVRREKVHQGPQILQIKIMISHDTQSS